METTTKESLKAQTGLRAEETPDMQTPEKPGDDNLAIERKSTYQTKIENEESLKQEFSRERTRGFVIRCDGEHATISAFVDKSSEGSENYWTVGQLVSIKVGFNRVVGLTCKVDVAENSWQMDDLNEIHITLELVGEIVHGEDDKPDKFSSGIANYPQMGCIAHRIRASDLATIYKSEGDTVVKVGQLTQDQSVDAKIEIDKLLSRHFAVVGTTGVGKSTSVTLIMRKIIKARPDIRILMLDPHNEFATAFPNDAVVVDSTNLLLPFWLFKLDEFSEVVFRGQEGFDTEAEMLRDLIPLAKEQYRIDMEKSGGSSLVKKKASGKTNLTADMPVPYRLQDLLKIIDDRLGLLEGKADKPFLKSLMYRLESISNDPRFRFMFDPGPGGDIMESIMSRIFRVPQEEKPICVLEMSGLPTEVVNSVVSVLSRMAFDLAANSDGAIQTLVVCEEAHRYIPADEKAGFWPTRQAIARIAKEGRKYGVFLCIITQRPGELDPTILSQCNTVFAMRLGNERDQEIIRGAVTNGAKSTISFLSSIANRECIAFGEAIQTPMRMTFETIRPEDLPGAHIYEQQKKVKEGLTVSLGAVLRRMRKEDRKGMTDDPYADAQVNNPSNPDQTPQQREPSASPGNEINSILNAAYSGQNGSLKPSADQGQPVRAAQQQQAAAPSAPAAKPQAPAQPAAPTLRKAEPAPEPKTPKPGGAGNLIRSFRSN
ncbi:MAG: DUF87 domain-containing protein [Pseudomonadota bacterium]